MTEEYVCSLNDASLKKAREELNEDPKDRRSALENFKRLINEKPYITCGQDDVFLLKFLRVGKFSQLEAMNRLERFLGMFNTMPEWVRDIDMTNPKLIAFLETGYYIPLGFNDDGQQVNLFNFGAFDTKSKKYSKKDMFQAIFGVMFHQARNENAIVNGFTGLADLTIFTIKHQTFWTVDDCKKMAGIMNGAVPVRWKQFYYYNTGPVFEVLWNIFTPFLKKKIKDRLVIVGSNLEAVYNKKVPMRLLPVEYLPDDYTGPNNGTIKDLIKRLTDEMQRPEVVARVKYETSDAFRLDESKRPKNEAPTASFRKLNVD